MKKGLVILILAMAGLLVVFGCANKYLTSGKIAKNSKNFDKAINDFTLALQTDSTSAEAHELIGECYYEKKDYILMNEHFAAAERFNPAYKDKIASFRTDAWAALFNSGNKNAKEEKWQDALKDFETAAAIIPAKYEAYTNAGYVFQHLENPDSAFYYYDKAVNLDKSNIKVIENFANIAFNMKKYPLADSLYGIIADKEPNNAAALMHRGEIADMDSNYEQAATFFNKSLEIDPKQCDVWFNLGLIYFQRMQRMEDAEMAFTRATTECPDDVNAFVNLNVALIQLNKFDDAITKLIPFTESHPDECIGWNLLAQAYIKKGMKDQALDADKKFKECQTSHPGQ
jgi:tetratricopeptide (TPR) repeat protein